MLRDDGRCLACRARPQRSRQLCGQAAVARSSVWLLYALYISTHLCCLVCWGAAASIICRALPVQLACVCRRVSCCACALCLGRSDTGQDRMHCFVCAAFVCVCYHDLLLLFCLFMSATGLLLAPHQSGVVSLGMLLNCWVSSCMCITHRCWICASSIQYIRTDHIDGPVQHTGLACWFPVWLQCW